MLLCTVRNCRLPLALDGRRYICPRAHSFDIARSGYVNLLQPQDRRSRNPGDTPEAIAARRRLHDSGVTAPLLDAIADLAAPTPSDIVLDAGCGEGSVVGALRSHTAFDAHGTDISIPAIDAAARRFPDCHWIVANADRFLPFADRSFSLILSITARVNAPEFHRVLRDGGRALIAVPAPDDLIELRGEGHDRAGRITQELASSFRIVDLRRATTTADLSADAVQDVLHSIYRPRRPHPIEPMRLTFSLDLVLVGPVAGLPPTARS
jgi:23S rRNA (guanine745-N1)-methyltransferase